VKGGEGGGGQTNALRPEKPESFAPFPHVKPTAGLYEPINFHKCVHGKEGARQCLQQSGVPMPDPWIFCESSCSC